MIKLVNLVLNTQVGMTKKEYIQAFSDDAVDVFNMFDVSKDNILQKEELAKLYYKTAYAAGTKAFLSAFTALGTGLAASGSKSTSIRFGMGALSVGNAFDSIDEKKLAKIASNRLKEILSSEEKILGVIKEELIEIKQI